MTGHNLKPGELGGLLAMREQPPREVKLVDGLGVRPLKAKSNDGRRAGAICVR